MQQIASSIRTPYLMCHFTISKIFFKYFCYQQSDSSPLYRLKTGNRVATFMIYVSKPLFCSFLIFLNPKNMCCFTLVKVRMWVCNCSSVIVIHIVSCPLQLSSVEAGGCTAFIYANFSVPVVEVKDTTGYFHRQIDSRQNTSIDVSEQLVDVCANR